MGEQNEEAQLKRDCKHLAALIAKTGRSPGPDTSLNQGHSPEQNVKEQATHGADTKGKSSKGGKGPKSKGKGYSYSKGGNKGRADAEKGGGKKGRDVGGKGKHS